MWLFLIIAVIVLIVVIKLLLKNDSCTSDASVDALEILRQRFARGEIDEETFEKMKHSLEDNR